VEQEQEIVVLEERKEGDNETAGLKRLQYCQPYYQVD
jgi:hypothetical protein